MNDILTKYNVTPIKVLKLSGLVLAVVFALLFISNVLGFNGISSMRTGMNGGVSSGIMGMMAPQARDDYGYDYGYEDDVTEEGYAGDMGMMKGLALSVRNVAGNTSVYPEPTPASPSGDGEAYEVTDYSATIETRNLTQTCAEIEALKQKEEVIFESSNTYDRGCSYSFKAEHASVDVVLELIAALDPRDISENTYTIKRQIDDFTSEEEILKEKLASIDETLKSAIGAYEGVTRLATQTQNAEALASVIDSRVNTIERLTQQRINTSSQLDRLARAKEEQLDRLIYTYFSVSVYEDTYFDGESVAASWKRAVQQFVWSVNQTMQDLTIGLITLTLLVVQYAVYVTLVLLVVKYGWRWGKRMWEM